MVKPKSERHAGQRTLSRLTTIAIPLIVSYGQTLKANGLYDQYLTNNGANKNMTHF